MHIPKSPKFVKIWLISVVLATIMCTSIFAHAVPMKLSVVGENNESPIIITCPGTSNDVDVYILAENVPIPPEVEKGVIAIHFILNYDPNCLDLVSVERFELTEATSDIEEWAMESNPPLDNLQSTGELNIALIHDPSEPGTIPPECWENEECDEQYPPNQAGTYWLPGDGKILKLTFHVIDCLLQAEDCTDLSLESVLVNEGEIETEVVNGQICCDDGPICTNALEVTGTVYDEDDQPVGAGYIVEVTNLNKPQYTDTDTTGADGTYAVGLFDVANPVACTGDVIEAVVEYPSGVTGRNQKIYQSGTSMIIDVRPPEKKFFTMTIQPGINMVSVPLDPQEPWTLADLCAKLQVDFMFYYDGSAFIYYGCGNPTTVLVEGGVGYVAVRNAPDPVEVTFEGVAWENASQPIQELATIQDFTNALEVTGTVYDEDGQPVGAGYTVDITNLNKPQYTVTTTTQADGTYSEGLFDVANPVAETGDEIEVVVKDSSGVTVLGSNQETYQSGTSMTIDVHFPTTKFFNFTFSPGINVIGAPLDPEEPWTLADLCANLPIDFMFYYDGSAFIYYGCGNPTTVPVEGGVGYVAVRNEGTSADYTYEGVAWENNVAAAPDLMASEPANIFHTNVFAVVGQIQQLKSEALDGLSLRIYNSRTKQTVSAKPTKDGSYSFVFFDLRHDNVIAAGDSLTVTIEDSNRVYQRDTFEITVDAEDIQNHRMIVESVKLHQVPKEMKLLVNYPNPFNPETWIPYQLSQDAHVTIRIYNLSGQLVRSLDLGRRPAGHYIAQSKAAYWNGTNQFGERVASGVYFYTLQADRFTATKKLFIMK